LKAIKDGDIEDIGEIQEDPDPEMAQEWIDNLYFVDTTGYVI
jgi:hypothetical protein